MPATRRSDRRGELAIEAQEDRFAVRAVLGLREQVGRTAGGIGRRIGDQDDLARPGRKVDRDVARDEQLRGGDPPVPGADDLVHRCDRLGAEGEGGHCLGAADRIDLVDSERMRGRERRLGRLRRDHRDALDPGDARRDGRHHER